jgi:hypothetical protein
MRLISPVDCPPQSRLLATTDARGIPSRQATGRSRTNAENCGKTSD